MSVQMDETFAAAVRTELVDLITDSDARRRRTRRRRAAVGVGAIVLIGGGTAIAAVAVNGLPGSDQVHYVATAVATTGSGTQTVPLGEAPTGANRIELQLTCLTPGQFIFADGASLTCEATDPSHTVTSYSLPITPGQDSTTITAGPNQQWHLIARYAQVSTTAWGTNAHGQTYGVSNQNGTPTLIAAIATNGKQGYIYADQLQNANPTPTSPAQAATMQPSPTTIPVYQSDGVTIIGQFVVGK